MTDQTPDPIDVIADIQSIGDAIETNVRAVMDPLPEGSRMDAYYFGFNPTGVGAIDAILSAVAIAGKGAHHTENWNDDGSGYYSDRPGLAPNTGVEEGSAATLIELTAVRSAARISALVSDHAALLAEVQRLQRVVPVVDDATLQEVEALIAAIRAMRPDPTEPCPPGWDADDRQGDRNIYRAAELLAAAYLGRNDK